MNGFWWNFWRDGAWPRNNRLDYDSDPQHDRIQKIVTGFFIYYCDFYREPRIKHEHFRQRFELSECFLDCSMCGLQYCSIENNNFVVIYSYLMRERNSEVAVELWLCIVIADVDLTSVEAVTTVIVALVGLELPDHHAVSSVRATCYVCLLYFHKLSSFDFLPLHWLQHSQLRLLAFSLYTVCFFLPRHALCALRVIAIVRTSVCPSVTLMYRGRIRWVSSKVITRLITSLIYSLRGTSPKFEWNSGGVALLNRKPAISLKRGKTEPKLLLMTNRKLHTRFRLVPKSVTFNWLWTAITHFIAQNMCLSEPTMNILMKIDQHYRRRRYSSVTLVSRNIGFLWIKYKNLTVYKTV